MADFRKLIRFKDATGQVYYGEAGDLAAITQGGLVGASVCVFFGENPWSPDFAITGTTKTISEVCSVHQACLSLQCLF